MSRAALPATIPVVSQLREVGGDVEGALERVNVPSYVIDDHGIIRWVNQAGRRLVGDVRGRQFTSVVAPEDSSRAREAFASHFVGAKDVDASVRLLNADGEHVSVEVSSVCLFDGQRIVGVFGQLVDVDDEPERPLHPHLTPRQGQVLRLLERGRSTDQIAAELHLSVETVRNHVRALFRALGVHSRLEAVALARQDHLL